MPKHIGIVAVSAEGAALYPPNALRFNWGLLRPPPIRPDKRNRRRTNHL